MEDEAATWYYYDDISGKVLDTKGVEKAEEMKLKSTKVFQFGKRFPGTRCPKEPKLSVPDGWM